VPVIVYIASFAIAVSVPIAWWSVASSRGGHRARQHLVAAGRSADLRSLRLELPAADRVWGPLSGWAVGKVRRITPGGVVDQMQRRIHLAGISSRWTVERVLGIKVLVTLTLIALGLIGVASSPSPSSGLLAISMVGAGWIMPDVVLRRRADTRQADIRRDLPDVIDQVMINVEAGQSFDAALDRVSRRGSGPAAEEFRRVMQDIQFGMTRREALELLVERTDVPDLRELVQSLAQAERYGVPLGRVLRVQADELRDKRKERAEERAQKVPIKILFPVIFCIFPALFVIILGPGILQVVEDGVI